MKKVFKKVLTKEMNCDIMFCVIQRQQVPVKAQAFLPRREIELQRCDTIFLFGEVCVAGGKIFLFV